MSSEADRWKQLDAASYDGVARSFDRHSRRLSGAAARRLASLAEIRSTDRVLDIGTGTGLLPFELIRCQPAPSSILGIDISSGMISTARLLLQTEWNDDPRIGFEEMDAEELSLNDGAFDVVLSAFALTHVPRPDAALREMWRVLRPGGRLAIALGSQPPRLSIYQVRHAVSEIGRKVAELRKRRLTASSLDAIVEQALGPSDDAPVGSPLSVQLNRTDLLRQLIADAGFSSLRTSWRNYQNEIDGSGEYWDLYRTIRSDVRKRLLTAPPALVDKVRDECIDLCWSTVERGGVLAYPISVVFISARKPV